MLLYPQGLYGISTYSHEAYHVAEPFYLLKIFQDFPASTDSKVFGLLRTTIAVASLNNP